MRGSLRLRHQASCPATTSGRQRDPRACRCSPAAQGRVAGVHRRIGYLPAGWRASDLLDFERHLAELRTRVLEGQRPPRERVVLLRDWAGPWFERIAAQVELGRMSPLTYNKYEATGACTLSRRSVACRSLRSTTQRSRDTCGRSSPRGSARRRSRTR
jgi:hypothetical protein